jgi:hypothetical protein
MDTVTYSNREVIEYANDNFVPLQVSMGTRAHWPHFRANHIIWTPSAGFSDHRGSLHHVSQGFLPPGEFLSAMRIGQARCLMAWARNAEAAHLLEEAASVENSMTPEALFWLAAAYFLESRETDRMYDTWEKLVELYPDSPWAMRTYPR